MCKKWERTFPSKHLSTFRTQKYVFNAPGFTFQCEMPHERLKARIWIFIAFEFSSINKLIEKNLLRKTCGGWVLIKYLKCNMSLFISISSSLLRFQLSFVSWILRYEKCMMISCMQIIIFYLCGLAGWGRRKMFMLSSNADTVMCLHHDEFILNFCCSQREKLCFQLADCAIVAIALWSCK